MTAVAYSTRTNAIAGRAATEAARGSVPGKVAIGVPGRGLVAKAAW
ncbi:hypothetical protein ACFYT3_31255 [Nocardia amikacinitolerans]